MARAILKRSKLLVMDEATARSDLPFHYQTHTLTINHKYKQSAQRADARLVIFINLFVLFINLINICQYLNI